MAKNHVFAGLDVGGNEVKLVIIQQLDDKDDFQILSQNREVCSGIRRGVVINLQEVSDAIISCVKQAQEQSDKKVKSVYVNIDGSHIFLAASHGLVSVSRADQKISQEDINRVIHAAQTFSLPSNKEILDVFPKEFVVDGEKGIRDPLGMKGVRLEADVLAIGCLSPYSKNLTEAVLESGLQIDGVIVNPLASARAVLTDRERELGVAVLDIGSSTTGLAVFEEGNLIHAAILPLGSFNITKDIAILLRIDIDEAERIKVEFGSCVWRGSKKKEKIKSDFLSERLQVSKKNLIDIIEARVSEIFEQANKELKKVSRQGLLPSGVVLTGGGAKLPKIVELAKKEMKLPSRIGLPRDFVPPQEDSSLAAACGLALSGFDLEDVSSASGLGGIAAKIKKVFHPFIP